MNRRRKIEVFSAGCGVCDEAVERVRQLSCPSCSVEVIDTRRPEIAARARDLGIHSLPAVLVEGRLAECCTGRGVDEAALRAAGVGQPLA